MTARLALTPTAARAGSAGLAAARLGRTGPLARGRTGSRAGSRAGQRAILGHGVGRCRRRALLRRRDGLADRGRLRPPLLAAAGRTPGENALLVGPEPRLRLLEVHQDRG